MQPVPATAPGLTVSVRLQDQRCGIWIVWILDRLHLLGAVSRPPPTLLSILQGVWIHQGLADPPPVLLNPQDILNTSRFRKPITIINEHASISGFIKVQELPQPSLGVIGNIGFPSSRTKKSLQFLPSLRTSSPGFQH